MEENNGRTVEPVNGNLSIEQLKENYNNLYKEATSIYNELLKFKQTWALQRAAFLFEVVKCDQFSTEFKMKAIEEIEKFLYPEPKEGAENTEIKEN